MAEDIPTKTKLGSFVWGVLAFFAGSLVSIILPYGGFILAAALYWFYLKKRGIQVTWYVVGYVFLTAIALLMLGSLLWWVVLTQPPGTGGL